MFANVNVMGEFPVHRVLAHSNTGQIVLIGKSGFSLRISKFCERFTQVERFAQVECFLTCFASRDKCSLRGGKRRGILALTLPRNRATIHHQDESRVQSMGVSITGPISITKPHNTLGFF